MPFKNSQRYQFIDYLMLANSLIIIREIHFFNINNKAATDETKTFPKPITLPFGSVVLPPEGDGR